MESKHCVRAWHIKRGINYKVEGHKKKGAKESLSPYSLPLPFLRLSRRPAFYRILMDFTGSRVSSIEQTFITVLLIICETVMDSGVTNSIENLWTLLTIHFNHDRFSVSLSGAYNIPKSIFQTSLNYSHSSHLGNREARSCLTISRWQSFLKIVLSTSEIADKLSPPPLKQDELFTK